MLAFVTCQPFDQLSCRIVAILETHVECHWQLSYHADGGGQADHRWMRRTSLVKR
jgi:hypothetical protein